MRPVAPLLALLLALPALAQPTPRLNPDAGPTAYVGGRWYDGEAFAPRDTVWAADGLFVAGPLASARVVDLGGLYVVPPFGDAHYHGLTDAASLAEADRAFVAAGMFYVQNPNNRRSSRDAVRGAATVVDAVYANGGITAPGAHPVPTYERQALGLSIQEMWDRADELRRSRRLDGDAYHLALTPADLDAVWPRVLAGRPDLVKVYLGGSDEWAAGTPAQPKGLSPAVVAEVVRRAEAAGLRVVAHVETAADARAALEAGVDALAHLPGYNTGGGAPSAAYVLDDALLADLAAAGVAVTPTFARGPAQLPYVPERYRPSPETQAEGRRAHRELLRRLVAAGVPLALGADLGSLTARDEAAYAVAVGGLTPAEALHAWAVDTPRALFPDRAVGRLTPGFEASLLALACDPTADFACTGRILHREKQGAPVGRTPRLNPDAGPTAYVGGLWYDGEGFVARDTTWADRGVFVDGPLADAEVLDLAGAYVVPPFADAHVHRVEGPWSLGGVVADHLAAGSFYVKNVNNIPRYAQMIAGDVNRPGGIDVAFSHGGITAPGAHPLPLYRNLVERGIYRDLVADSLDGVAAHGLATVADLEARWPAILADRPDHIKLLLLDHESGRGLRPDVFRRAVALAREAGLPTTVHVATAADLALAVDAGADEAAHLPGLFGDPDAYDRYRISPTLAARMAAAGFVTVPTSVITSERRPEAEGAVAENVRRLLAAGAPVAMGTDGFGTSGVDEAANLVRIGAMDGPTALRLLVETGPVSVFPGRAIGRLAPGFEASFLALACDAVADLGCARQIRRRVKQGHDLDAAALAETAAAWRALDVATFTAAPRFSDGPLLRGLKAYVDGDLDAAADALASAQAVAPDSLAAFVRGLRADVAAEGFDFATAVALRAEDDPSARGSVEAGFARFPAPRLAMDAPEATVPFDGLAVPAAVNGVPVRAIVDTGAPGTGIPRALVERLGLRVDTTARGVSRVPSMGLEFEVFAVRIDSVTVGGATFFDVPATVGWTDDPPDPDAPLFLGADVLRYLAAGLRYDYADSTFTVLRELPETDERPTFVIDARSAPVVPVTVAGQAANAILDTGNQQAVYLAAGAFDLADAPVVETRSGAGWSVDFRDVPLAIPGHPDGPRRAYEGAFVFAAGDPVTVILGKPVWAGGALTLDFVNRRATFAPAEAPPASAE